MKKLHRFPHTSLATKLCSVYVGLMVLGVLPQPTRADLLAYEGFWSSGEGDGKTFYEKLSDGTTGFGWTSGWVISDKYLTSSFDPTSILYTGISSAGGRLLKSSSVKKEFKMSRKFAETPYGADGTTLWEAACVTRVRLIQKKLRCPYARTMM